MNIFSKQNLHFSKSQGGKTYTESTLFPILPLEKLLPTIEKRHYLDRLKEIVALPDDYFEIFYESLIDNFALFVQSVPEIYGEELGGLLTEGLRRSLLAIQILTTNQQEKPHPLFLFAVYSIALLTDLGYLFNYRIMISDEKGAFVSDWYPNLGYMSEYGEHFKLRPYDGTPTSLVRSVTPLLARQLLNETSMTWLASNNGIFDMWLAFLNKEDWAGGLGKILKIDKRQFDKQMEFINDLPIQIKTTEPLGMDMAEKFLQWLKNGLQDGSITYNEADSKVHVVQSDLDIGVFLQAPELFQQFLNVYPKTRDWIVVCKQFNLLGLTKLSGNDVKFEQFFSETPDSKSSKLGFLTSEKKGEKVARDANLPSQMLTAARTMIKGVVVKDAKILFGSKVPTASQYLRNADNRVSLDNSLPKLPQSNQAAAAQNQPSKKG